MGKDGSIPSRKSHAASLAPYPPSGSRAMDEVLDVDGAGVKPASKNSEKNKRKKEKKKKAKEEAQATLAALAARSKAAEEGTPFPAEEPVTDEDDSVIFEVEKDTPTETEGAQEKSRKEKARDKAEQEVANMEPKGDWADEAVLPELPTEWPDLNLSSVLMTGLDQVGSLGKAAMGSLIGVVPYGYERFLKAHTHLVTSVLQEKVKEAFPDGGYQLSNWEMDLLLGIGVTKKGGEMDEDCVKVAEWLVNPANRVLVIKNQAFLIGSFASLNVTGTVESSSAKAKYIFDVQGLPPMYWSPADFGRGWRPLWRGPLAKLKWTVLSSHFSNVNKVEVECTPKEWKDFLAKRKPAVKKLGGNIKFSDPKVTPLVKCLGCKSLDHEIDSCELKALKARFDLQRAKADARKQAD
ncbi:hypothetical protein FRC08_001307 [Ceratobasidium sp. 394]|nr:hypothetical protein FRC08_001307 [Ceratobasidium sp. 394]